MFPYIKKCYQYIEIYSTTMLLIMITDTYIEN